jgi:hypothetical protein
LDKLENELEKATPDEAAIQVREAELAEAQEEFKNCENVYEDLQTQKIQLNEENRANKREMEEAQKRVADIRSRLEKAHMTVRTYQGTRDDELRKKNKAIESVAEAEEVKKSWEAELEEQRNELVAVISGAKSICEDRVFVPPDLNSEELRRKMVNMEATRKKAERELGGSQLDLTRAATEAKQKHHDAMQDFEDIRSLRNVSVPACRIGILANMVQQLITTLNNRRNRWKLFRSSISVRARVTFNYLLSERKFRGTLSIDHQKALLDIHVSVNTKAMLHMALTHQGSTGYHGAKRRRQTDQDALRRREVVLYRVSSPLTVGCNGLTYSLPRRVVSYPVSLSCGPN